MIFERYHARILIRVLLMFITLSAASYLFVKGRGYFIYLAVIVPIIIFQLVDFYRFHRKAQDEVEQFVESIQ
jgi:two-component system nitrogen regulation sensor histidine kinase NtrY